MKRLLLAAVALIVMATAASAVEPMGVFGDLKDRGSMVAAVAILVTTPPNCSFNKRPPTGEEIALFVVSRGHRPDDALMAEIEAQVKKVNDGFEGLDESGKRSVVEATCAVGIYLTKQVADR